MKRLSTLLLALVCAAGTMYAGYGWTPNKKYCKWGDNFRFDHAFKFHNGFPLSGSRSGHMAPSVKKR